MNRAAIESRIGRLQNVEWRNPLTVCVGREERVVGGTEQPPMVSVRQRPYRRVWLPLIAIRRLTRHPHIDAVREGTFGIARAHAALGELRNVVGYQREAGALSGRKIGRAILSLASDAFQAA